MPITKMGHAKRKAPKRGPKHGPRCVPFVPIVDHGKRGSYTVCGLYAPNARSPGQGVRQTPPGAPSKVQIPLLRDILRQAANRLAPLLPSSLPSISTP